MSVSQHTLLQTPIPKFAEKTPALYFPPQLSDAPGSQLQPMGEWWLRFAPSGRRLLTLAAMVTDSVERRHESARATPSGADRNQDVSVSSKHTY